MFFDSKKACIVCIYFTDKVTFFVHLNVQYEVQLNKVL